MAKPTHITFGELFEPIVAGAWDQNKLVLDGKLVQRTREAASYIRRVYKFKDEAYPSRLNYTAAKNRAGYLAAFGERHAYLAYHHLKELEKVDPDAIPSPNAQGELTVSILGAGAALETYGLCLFYNESKHKLKCLRLNLIEKVEQWKPTRLTVFGRMLKQKFPKIRIFSNDIDVDLTNPNCIQKFAENHDQLTRTRILFSYNVMNEIETRHATMVFRNLRSILRQCDNPLLILLAEPTAPKAWPRIKWIREQLAQCSRVVMNNPDADVQFTDESTCIAFEGTGKGLNDRLFGRSSVARHAPVLMTSLRRMLMTCQIQPQSPVSPETVRSQLAKLNVKREKGRFVAKPLAPENQFAFPNFI